MERRKILEAIIAACKGKREVKVKFKAEEKDDSAVYLFKMHHAKFISLYQTDQMIVVAVIKRGYWGRDSEHIFPITFTDNFDAEMFLTLLEDSIDTIEALV